MHFDHTLYYNDKKKRTLLLSSADCLRIVLTSWLLNSSVGREDAVSSASTESLTHSMSHGVSCVS